MNKCGKPRRQTDAAAAPSGASCAAQRAEHGGAMAGVRACSACAGDYEDPDRTAWTPDEDGGEGREDDEDELGIPREQVPAEEP
ncbi:MAG: hypothetical protein WBB89_08500 [Candidatus Acidiferrum sp.]